MAMSSKRLGKELAVIKAGGCPEGITLARADDLETWEFDIAVLGDETIYKGETFRLRLKFGPRYPIESPEVTFVVNRQYQAPMMSHVYSNTMDTTYIPTDAIGHICASILGDEWSPVLNAIAVCISMQSMLASSKKKERPQGNDSYVRTAPLNPKDTKWHYDDDKV